MVHRYPLSVLAGKPRQRAKAVPASLPARGSRSVVRATERFMFSRLFLVTGVLLGAITLVTMFPA